VLSETALPTRQIAVLAPPSSSLTEAEVLDALRRAGVEHAEAESLQALADLGGDPATSAIVLIGDGPAPTRARILQSVREHSTDARIVLVWPAPDGRDVRAALSAGARGIVAAAEVSAALAPCLQAVLAGQICVPHGAARQIQRPVLSAREKQILGLVVMGYLNSQIAQRLYLAESTVKSHLTSAFGKLEVRSRHEAVDLILNPEFGLALGILSLGGDPVQEIASETL